MPRGVNTALKNELKTGRRSFQLVMRKNIQTTCFLIWLLGKIQRRSHDWKSIFSFSDILFRLLLRPISDHVIQA